MRVQQRVRRLLCLVVMMACVPRVALSGGGHPPYYATEFQRVGVPVGREGVLEHLNNEVLYFLGPAEKGAAEHVDRITVLAEHWAELCKPEDVLPLFRRLCACKERRVRDLVRDQLAALGTDAEWQAGLARYVGKRESNLMRAVARHWKRMPPARQDEIGKVFRRIMADGKDEAAAAALFEMAYFRSLFHLTLEEKEAFLDHRLPAVRNRAWGWWLSRPMSAAVRQKLPAALNRSRVARMVLRKHGVVDVDVWEQVREPGLHALVRSVTLTRGKESLGTLRRLGTEGSTWYRRVIARSMAQAVGSPERQRRYEETFAALSGGPLPEGADPAQPITDADLTKEEARAVPFLIEGLFVDRPTRVPDRTRKGWHVTRPQEAACRLLMELGGADAGRAVAVYLIAGAPLSADVIRASRLTDKQLADEMLRRLDARQPDPRLAWVLGELGASHAVSVLIGLLGRDDAKLCQAASGALVRLGKPAVVPLIRCLVSATRRRTREWSRAALLRLLETATERLHDGLRTGKPVTRREAVLSIGMLSGSDALRRALEDVWPGSAKDQRAINLLIASLTVDDVDVCLPVATALGSVGEPAIPHLVRALGDAEKTRRSWAGHVLYKIGPASVPALVKVLDRGPDRAHYQAVRALRFIRHRSAVPALVKALASPDPYARLEAALALGELADPAAKDPLLRALNDPGNWTAPQIHGIAGAVGAFKDPRAYARLLMLSRDKDWQVRRAALTPLGQTGGKKAVPVLTGLLTHPHPSTRGDAAIALGRLKDRDAVSALIAALSDPELFVSSWAAWALGEIGDRRAVEPLREALQSKNRTMVRVAGAALRKIKEADGPGTQKP